jgi:hypothetical protein
MNVSLWIKQALIFFLTGVVFLFWLHDEFYLALFNIPYLLFNIWKYMLSMLRNFSSKLFWCLRIDIYLPPGSTHFVTLKRQKPEFFSQAS